jgi:hypothetical protein
MPAMNRPTIGRVVAAVAVLAVAAGAWIWWSAAPAPEMPAAAPPVAAVTPEPAKPAAASAPAGPVILHPLEAASEPAATASVPPEPLPALADADDFVARALTDLLGRRGVLQFLQVDGFVQRVVATVDNLPAKHASPRLWPVQPTPGRFATRPQGETLQMDPDNAQRYLPLVQMVEAVSPVQAAALYRRLYPLFQQAYQELGYPQGYFNDRLVQVIDHLRATPQVEGTIAMTLTEVKGPYAATAPWLRYEFADPALQELSAGQRALLRSGVVNQRRLLAWLAAFRTQIAR